MARKKIAFCLSWVTKYTKARVSFTKLNELSLYRNAVAWSAHTSQKISLYISQTSKTQFKLTPNALAGRKNIDERDLDLPRVVERGSHAVLVLSEREADRLVSDQHGLVEAVLQLWREAVEPVAAALLLPRWRRCHRRWEAEGQALVSLRWCHCAVRGGWCLV